MQSWDLSTKVNQLAFSVSPVSEFSRLSELLGTFSLKNPQSYWRTKGTRNTGLVSLFLSFFVTTHTSYLAIVQEAERPRLSVPISLVSWDAQRQTVLQQESKQAQGFIPKD